MSRNMQEETESTMTDREESGGGDAEYQDSNFIRLEDLVYAPLHALVKSNQQLRSEVLETVRSMATVRQQGQEEIIQLNHMNIAYDQIRNEEEDNSRVDKLQMQLPLLSLVPLTSLSIEKADISFSAEVCVDGEQEENVVKARICSPEQRESDFLPKVNYHLQVGAVPAAEGIMRLTDLLRANQVVQQTDTMPMGVQGKPGTAEQKQIWKEIDCLKAKVKKLKLLFQKVQRMLEEQERMHQISKDGFMENVYDYDRDKYAMVKTNIMNRIMKYQTRIMDLEIAYGLDHEDE